MVESSKPQSATRPSRLDNVHNNIFTPKLFLIELLETILRKNTIACLVNDTGKHFLFVSVLKRLSHLFGKSGNHDKIALFVASSKLQAEVISRCIAIHSMFKVTICNEPSLPLVEGFHVIVATASIVVALLTEGYLTSSKIEIVVFDECHLVVENQDYMSVACMLCDSCLIQSASPRILAVTSSILSEQCWNPVELKSLVTTLENVFKARAEVAPELVPSVGSCDRSLRGDDCKERELDLDATDNLSVISEMDTSHSTKLATLIAEGLQQKPKEMLVYCKEFQDSTGLVVRVKEELSRVISFVNDYPMSWEGEARDPLHSAKVALNECMHILHELGPWCASVASRAINKQLGKLEFFEKDKEVKRILTLAATTLRVINKMVDDYFDKNVEELEQFMALTSSKVVALIGVLHQQKPDDSFTIVPDSYDNDFAGNAASDDEMTSSATNQTTSTGSDDDEDGVVSHEAWSKGGRAQAAMGCVVFRKEGVAEQEEEEMQCVVFVERKHVAFALNKLIVELCNWDVNLYFVRSHYVVSVCPPASGVDSNATEVQKQEEVMRKFRTKEINLLVSTAVLEGGIELPRCNLVVRFSPSPTYKSYIQSKAKARSPRAKFVHLVDPCIKDLFEKNFCAYKGIEKILFNRCCHQQKLRAGHVPPNPITVDAMISPYSVNSLINESATVTMTTAIKTINRYCAKLPSDTFTHLAPKCSIETIREEEHEMFRAILKLPINSPIKEAIKGPPMESIELAKMAAALEMCKVLHLSGELDDQLQPVSKDYPPMRKEEEEDDDVEWEGPIGGQGHVARPGSTKRKQYYKKRIAFALQGTLQANEPAHLYIFHMKLTGPITDEQNTRGRTISAPETTSRGFGLLVPKLLQHVPHFPVFTRSGEVTVKVDLMTKDIVFDQSQLNRLHAFHRFLFSQVLKLEKLPMHFSPETAESGCVVVPINKDDFNQVSIDWTFIYKVETYPQPTSSYRHKQSHPGGSKSSSVSKSKNSSLNLQLESSKKEPLVGNSDIKMPKNEGKQVSGWGELDLKDGERKQWVTNDDALINLPNPKGGNKVLAGETVDHPTVKESSPKEASEDEPITEASIANNNKSSILKEPKAATKQTCNSNALKDDLKVLMNDGQKQIFYFDEKLFADAVVTPSYRNVDQPQYFYVAEIRHDLSLSSPFPSPELYETFRHYYASKYGLVTTNENQPLLDVDHTSARLNLLTPRYVNQKGVALPITSIENRRAKRESLQQKQILVPELCYVHPFPTSLWQKAVCVPTILYRINYLLIADELRIKIATEACQWNPEDLAKAIPTDTGLQFRFAVDGETTSTLAVSRRSGRRTCDELPGKVTNDASLSDSDSGIESNGENGMLKVQTIESNLRLGNDSCHTQDNLTKNSFDENINDKAFYATQLEINCPTQTSSLDSDSNTFGPSSCDIIQTLTMSNANDFFNLERLETIGDSFLKFAITVYLYCTYPGIHEGKLSYLRSIQVSNCNLYRLGRKKGLPECMVASKFEPVENWLPPCYAIKTLDHNNDALNWRNPGVEHEDGVQEKSGRTNDCSDQEIVPNLKSNNNDKRETKTTAVNDNFEDHPASDSKNSTRHQQMKFEQELKEFMSCSEQESISEKSGNIPGSNQPSRIVIPYNLQMEHSLPDKSIADCVEALIGCYLACADQNTALRLMAWLGLKVLPVARHNRRHDGCFSIPREEHLEPPPSPLLHHVSDPEEELNLHLQGYEEFENLIQYKFKDRSYLLQAFTHASYHCNEVTDCYQRLEFLGDAILDYVITRHLFEDSIEHSPGILTDLRSALVNNNIFAFLAVKWNYHKYLKYIAPQLFVVIERFISWFESRGEEAIIDDVLDGESWLDDNFAQDTEEDIEVPKVLGDVFESVAGAIYLDSGLSLDTVWTVYRRLMDRHIAVFLKKIPKSPVRELLETEPETAKFEKPERTLDGRFRVTVNIVGKGIFKGTGRNYRIAKTAAAKRALKHLKLSECS